MCFAFMPGYANPVIRDRSRLGIVQHRCHCLPSLGSSRRHRPMRRFPRPLIPSRSILLHSHTLQLVNYAGVSPKSERNAVGFNWPLEAVTPPSTGRFTPLMKDASSLARNAMTGAISSGFAPRPSGIRSTNFSIKAACCANAAVK